MIDLVLRQYAATLAQTHQLVADIDDATMASQPGALINHPAWTLGHLCVASSFALQLLGEPVEPVADEVTAKYRPGSKPVPTRSEYASKQELLAWLDRVHAAVEAAVRAKHADYFAKPSPPAFQKFAPTIGALVFYLVAAHESYHLGQLAQWRRAMNLSS